MTTTTRSSAPGVKRKSASKKSTAKSSPKNSSSKKEPTHPKLVARRDEVERGENRRRLRTVGALVVITLAAIGALAALDSSLLDVDRVLVNGAVRTDPAEAVEMAAILEGDPLAELDLTGAARRIETLPWVASASLERQWNGDVRISIVERQPVAAVPTAAALVLIDEGGRQLEVIDTQPTEMLPIGGVLASGVPGEPAPPAARAAVNVLRAMSPDLTVQVVDILIDAEGLLTVQLVQGGVVTFGDDSSLEAKLIGLETMLARADLRCLASIDLRVPSAPALLRVSADGTSTVLDDLSTCT